MTEDAFWIDHQYDGDQADRAGGSRFANYIRLNESWFADCWDWPETAAANFAATAWRIANGPVMAPGYVRRHPKILRAALERSDWDGKLLACVDLITPAPQALRQSSEWGGRWWRSWPSESLFSREAYSEPSGEELARDPYILPSVSLRWAVPMIRVLTPTVGRPALPGLQSAAKRCVADLVAELNSTINPVLAQLGRS